MRIPLIAMGLLLGAASVATGQTVRGVYLRAGDTRFTNDLGRAPTAESASSLSDMEKLARGFITVRSGEDLDPASASRDVRAIQKSGRFSYAEVKTETVPGGVNLLYVVEPMTRIRRLSVDGADELGNKRVRELLELGVGDLVDDALLSARAAKVREEYRKKYFPEARLTWKITPDAGSGTANVEIKVEEGRRSYVRHIKFEGNKAVSAGSLRKAMAQKERIWWWSWISGRGTYKPEDLSADVEILRRLYLDRGHLDASIGEPKLVRSGDLIDVTIPVREGVVYRLGDSRIEGAQALSADQISKAVTNLPGSVLSVAALERTQQAIEDVYATHGYLGSRAAYEIIPHGSGTVVDVRYRVREGEPAKIGDIHIRGNTRTKDEVIRRELTVYPSEIYNSVKVRNSERRLQNLGYFDFVSAVPDETDSPSLYDVLVSVEEARTGNLMFGVGYSSIDNLIGFVEVTQGNFDLFNWPPTGGGQKLKLRGTVGTQRQDMELSFVEPWFLDRKLSLGIDVYQRDSRFLSDKYEQLNTGAALTLGRPLDNFTRLNLTYGLEEIEVTKVDPSASQQIKDEEGAQLKSYLQLQLVRDSRDSSFVATRGNRTMLSATVAGGPLGGDTEIYGLEAQSSQYFPVWFDHVLNLRGWMEVVEPWGNGDRVPIFDRLFLGGQRNLRGFKYRDVGPKYDDGEPKGGQSAWYLIAEYNIPLAERFRFAMFYDMGMVSEEAYDFQFSNYNSDVGIGLRLDIQGFPLRLDYAWPLETDAYNDRGSGRFQFSIGYSY